MQDKELKRQNKKLEQRTKELTASNKELEQFAYMISHDLQEPLRMVTSFLQLLEKKYKGKIDEESTTYIHFAVDGANRMKQLIENLLNLSKAGNYTDKPVDTDMNEIAQEAINIYKNRILELKAKIIIASLPVLPVTAKEQVLHLFLNLVDNALKYNTNTPIIEIAAEKKEWYWLFSVKDNGIGIEAGAEDKIFALFYRLHNRDKYPGTGIGLAMSRKIAEKLGGSIWVEPGDGTGSTFYFTLPCT